MTKGFTIIELLVVIAIIAILSAVILVNVSNYEQRDLPENNNAENSYYEQN